MSKEPESQDNVASTVDPQKQFLIDQFGNLMEQVGDGFGGPLQQELIKRLEQTIADFHEEVNEMLEKLKDNSEKRHEKLKEIWNNPEAATATASSPEESDGATDSVDDDGGLSTQEMSDWEKKLEAADAKVETTSDEPKEEDAGKKKKGFFGRKKK